MVNGHSGCDGSASAKPFSRQNVEKGLQLRSQLGKLLNVPQRVRFRFFLRCSLAGRPF